MTRGTRARAGSAISRRAMSRCVLRGALAVRLGRVQFVTIVPSVSPWLVCSSTLEQVAARESAFLTGHDGAAVCSAHVGMGFVFWR